MTIYLISGQKGSGKSEFAAALGCTILNLTEARLTSPLAYPKDLTEALSRLCTPDGSESTAIVGITTLDEVRLIKTRFASEKVVLIHMSVSQPATAEEEALIGESDFIVSSTAKLKEIVTGWRCP